MRRVMILLTSAAPVLVLLMATVNPPKGKAVPSFARQTGLPCSGCHYTPPELNPAGRRFKLLGYVDRADETKVIKSDPGKKRAPLDLLSSLPLSAWLETSFTSTKSSIPGTQNGSLELPQDISLFISGAWTTHVGSFMQVTYDTQDDHFSMDNTDIRYANKTTIGGKELVFGLNLNNNPTVEDLWNSTLAWGFPFGSSNSAPSPSATAIVNGSLAQDVAGFGGYTMWNDHLYLAGTLYRSEHIGGSQPNPGTGFGFNVRGIAPYWRLAWQSSTANNNFEIGTYGMHVKSSPNAVTGLMDGYTDRAFDFQYDRTIPRWKNDVLSFRGTYIRENSSLVASFAEGAAAVASHHLNTVQGNIEYHFGTRFSGTVGYFDVTGTTDPLLFAQAPVSGSANGSTQSNGYLLNFSWWPQQNIDLAVQYTGYARFNGAGTNYDGAGRNAAANNSTYLLVRFVFC